MTDRIHSRLPADVKAAIFISSAIGGLIVLQDEEPASHTRRYREIDKAMGLLSKIMEMYPDSGRYDLVRLGHRFFKRMESELEIILASGELENYTQKGR